MVPHGRSAALLRAGGLTFRRALGAASHASSAPPTPGGPSSEESMGAEGRFSAHNYHPLPVVFSTARNATVTDPEGRTYLDFLSAYSAVNMGHCHPKILAALHAQAERCTLSSRAFYNDQFGAFAEYITKLLGFDMILPMNTGAEGVETALKLARKWGYLRKGIERGQALIVSCCGCFHGRTLGAVAMSCDPSATRDFGPALPGQFKVDFGDAAALEAVLREQGGRVAAFIVEPIQGEAGVVIPPPGYLKRARELCTEHNVLMIADEVQTGIARTGRMLACDHEGVRPDVLILGKAISGGALPVSAVLADKDVMLCIQPGEHGSTFGGNPLSSAVARAALGVVVDERLPERAERLGRRVMEVLEELKGEAPGLIDAVRGRGLLSAVVINPARAGGVTAYDVCIALKERGVLAKPTQENVIRLAPPITIEEEDLEAALAALRAVVTEDLPGMQGRAEERARGRGPPPPPDPCERCGRVMLH